MKRLVFAVLTMAVLVLPLAVSAQSPSPAAVESPPVAAESPLPATSEPPLIGVDTMDVCLAITGPVIELTPEALTQGIIDGTFVIEGLSTECEVAGPMASPMDGVEPGASPMVPEASPMAPEASPMTSPAA